MLRNKDRQNTVLFLALSVALGLGSCAQASLAKVKSDMNLNGIRIAAGDTSEKRKAGKTKGNSSQSTLDSFRQAGVIDERIADESLSNSSDTGAKLPKSAGKQSWNWGNSTEGHDLRRADEPLIDSDGSAKYRKAGGKESWGWGKSNGGQATAKIGAEGLEIPLDNSSSSSKGNTLVPGNEPIVKLK